MGGLFHLEGIKKLILQSNKIENNECFSDDSNIKFINNEEIILANNKFLSNISLKGSGGAIRCEDSLFTSIN